MPIAKTPTLILEVMLMAKRIFHTLVRMFRPSHRQNATVKSLPRSIQTSLLSCESKNALVRSMAITKTSLLLDPVRSLFSKMALFSKVLGIRQIVNPKLVLKQPQARKSNLNLAGLGFLPSQIAMANFLMNNSK